MPRWNLNPFQSGWLEPVRVCRDCEKVWQEIAKEAGSTSYTRLLTPEAIASIIRPEAHAEHDLISYGEIDEVVQQLKRSVERYQVEVGDIDW